MTEFGFEKCGLTPSIALLREKIRLMKKYRHHKPRIDKDILWRPIPGAVWPKFE